MKRLISGLREIKPLSDFSWHSLLLLLVQFSATAALAQVAGIPGSNAANCIGAGANPASPAVATAVTTLTEAAKNIVETTDPKSIAFRKAMNAKLGNSALRTVAGRKQMADGQMKDYGLTDDEVAAISGYTSGDYITINSALRNGGHLLQEVQPIVDMINSGLAKLPDYIGLVNRGADLPDSVLSAHQPGVTLTYVAFTSTSVGMGFSGRHRFQIQSSHCKDIAKISGLPQEKEVLCASGTKFKILDRKEVGSSTNFVMKEVP